MLSSRIFTASVSDNVVTIPVGYIASQRTVTVGTAKAAATYTPTTSDQTIAANLYLTGAQTIKGDANLVAANIAEGVSIFGVTGTHGGGGGEKAEIVGRQRDILVLESLQRRQLFQGEEELQRA